MMKSSMDQLKHNFYLDYIPPSGRRAWLSEAKPSRDPGAGGKNR